MSEDKKSPQPMKVEQIKQIVAKKKSDRSNWETLWQDIGDYIFPRKNTAIVERVAGEDLQVTLYDNTAQHANELFAGVMMSILMSIEEPWFELTSGDPELDGGIDEQAYLQKSVKAVHNVMANSNFYNEAHEMLLDLGSFGTNIFGIEEDDKEVVRYFSKFIGEGFIGENARGQIDEVYLEFKWTARQIASEYPKAELPDKVKKSLEKGDEAKFRVIHAIYPVDRQDANAQTPRGHKYFSDHVMPDENARLKLSGFNSFPYAVPRHAKATGEEYGRSPGMVALPEAKVLNKMVEITLVGAEKVIDPPLQAPDDGFINQINTFPASISYYRAGGNDRIEPIFNNSRIDFGFQIIEEKQNRVRDAFYINQMMLPNKSGNPITAAEVSQKVEQATRFMGPFLARMQKEFLQVVVDRTIEICFKKGILKKEDIPPKLRGKQFTVRYTSYIAKAQRAGTLGQIMKFFQAFEPVMALDPSSRHYINSAGTLKTIMQLLGVPAEMINSDSAANKLIEAEAQQRQQMAQAQVQAQQVDTLSKAAQAGQQVIQGQQGQA